MNIYTVQINRKRNDCRLLIQVALSIFEFGYGKVCTGCPTKHDIW